MSEMTPYSGAKNVAQINDQRALVRQVLESQMQNEVHYGVIAGTKNPTLYKAGAEMLLSVFHIALRPEIIDLSNDDSITYRVKALGVHMGTNVVVGEGVGECSTNEEKYKWRGAGEREWNATPESRRRIKYGSVWAGGQKQEIDIQQVRTNPADQANTVLKMAKKRAEVDLCLTALAVSDMFTQDLEDIDQETGEVTGKRPAKYGSTAPKAKSAAPAQSGAVTAPQANLLRIKLEQAGIDAEAFCKEWGVGAVPELPFAKMNEALAWITKQGKPA